MNALRLTRAGQDVQSFFSILGGLRETRLTAALGFLVSRFPTEFGLLLGFETSPADEISVEESDEGDRYDVLIRASGEIHIIEGKIGTRQNADQLLRYIRTCRRKPSLTVVDDGSKFRHSRQREFREVLRRVQRLDFVTWADVGEVCRRITFKNHAFEKDRVGAVVAHELYTHLQENKMTKEPRSEIYLRDVSTIDSVKLYFRYGIYKCQPSFYNSARPNLYFAPYFTQQTASQVREENLVPLGEGISFISRIEKVQVVDKRDVLACLKADRHPHPKEAAKLIRGNHEEDEVLLMTLGEPRLLFVSPVTKAKLRQANLSFGRGAMGSRSCSFDDLLAASR